MLQALLAFVWEISHREEVAISVLAGSGVALTDDWVIVITSARLSIALIPVLLVWFLASRFARWMVTVLAIGRLINMPAIVGLLLQSDGATFYPVTFLGAQALALFAAGMLFTPQARNWFDWKGRPHAEHFD
ncbi:hypothetical protein [Alteraurantiacibacter aestuarii]|uniref:Uncharacterized protein n=1 Tax=Alteraurantiacibacter aestuarii TaxID=650004 RepID=A0A844ZNY7_9SPHN|nr:hypothetical protein [Alteraurantiacibacter aestuarii]MXO88537.1 hypothetical protein [Alteraurantiacibacter aestuarii]